MLFVEIVLCFLDKIVSTTKKEFRVNLVVSNRLRCTMEKRLCYNSYLIQLEEQPDEHADEKENFFIRNRRN